MNCRSVYLVGFALGLVGSLATAAGLFVAGQAPTAVMVFATSTVFVLAVRNTRDREDFDRDHRLLHRVVNWVGASVVLALGLVMVLVGLWSLVAFP